MLGIQICSDSLIMLRLLNLLVCPGGPSVRSTRVAVLWRFGSEATATALFELPVIFTWSCRVLMHRPLLAGRLGGLAIQGKTEVISATG